MRATLPAAAALLLAGCSAEPAVIAGISESEVTIRQTSGTPDSAVTAEASEGCALYGRIPTHLRYTCGESGCRTKFHVFACTAPALAGTAPAAPAPDPAAAAVAQPAQPPQPLLPPPPSPSPPPAPAAPAAAAPDGFWQQPLEGPVISRAPAPAAEPAPPEAATSFFADACAEYLTDQAMHLRCQIVTGPDRDQYIPPAGRNASLADQMRCHPLREDPVGYDICLQRRS